MFRIVLAQLVLFLLPFVVYAAWIWLAKKSNHPERWGKGPMAWLTVAGLALAISGLVAMTMINRSPEGSNYRPAQIKDGEFIPGGFE